MKRAKDICKIVKNKIDAYNMCKDITEYMYASKMDKYTFGTLCSWATSCPKLEIQSPISGKRSGFCADYLLVSLDKEDLKEVLFIYNNIKSELEKYGYEGAVVYKSHKHKVINTTWLPKRWWQANPTSVDTTEDVELSYPVLEISANCKEECKCSTTK